MTDERCQRTAVLVEATDFEQQSLWRFWATDGDARPIDFDHPRYDWVGDAGGRSIVVGRLDKDRPVAVTLTWATIAGILMCFWSADGRYADHDMIDAWLNANFPQARRTDATNFHNAFTD